MCSSPSARGPKSQLVMNHQQEDAGTHQKRIHYVQGQRRSWNKIVGGAQHDKIKSHTSWVDDLQSGEECYQRSSPTDVSLMSASQPGDHAKGLGIPRESDFESQWDLITELSKNWGKQETTLLEDTNKLLCVPRPRATEQWPHRRLNQTYLLVLECPLWRFGSAVACHGDGGTGGSLPGRGPLV